jgi:hypothetical protein
MNRWMLSHFYFDTNGSIQAVCAAYGNRFLCPAGPITPDAFALVLLATSSMQLAAAAQDPDVLLMPLIFDPSPVPQILVDTYAARGVTTGMSMAQVICKLSESEPRFLLEIR